MAKYDFNTVVIGGGAAGLVSALVASAVNAKVALIEKHQMGGDCLNTGCVPSKALIKAGRVAHDIKHASKFGIHCQAPEVNFQEVMQGVHQAIKTIEPHDSVQRFSKLGVACFSGDAVIETPHRVKVNGQLLTTRSIIIASGAEPIIPDIPGLDSCDYMTSETLWELQALPKKLLVLGGGPIGCEMTQAFSRLGSQVTVVDRNTRLMKREDDDVSEHIHQVFNSEGIDVRLQAQIESISGNTAYIRQGEGITEIAFDGILLALGRKARVSGFGLEALGIELDQGHTIAANAFLQTNIPNIFVCGDAVAPFQFTHTAAHQAWYACVNALFTPFKKFKVDYSVIPWATFTDPEVARVGLNEREAKAQNIAHEVTIYPLSELDRAITEQSNTGFIKVLTAGRSDKILGVSFVGEHAGDLIAEFVFAMKHNLGLSKVLATIHIYPTWAEANKFAAGEWRKKHVPAFALTALSIFHRWRRS